MLRPRARRRPRYPLPAARWLRYLEVLPAQQALSLDERQHLAGVLARWLQEPVSYTEEPGHEESPVESMPGFRPAPWHRWAPTDTPFGLCWPQHTDEDEWALAHDEHDDPEWLPPDEPPRISIEGDAVVLRLRGTGLHLCPDRIELLHELGEDLSYSEDINDGDLIRAAAGLTDWTVLDSRQQRAFEPVRCASCGRDYELSAAAPACPACGHDRIWVLGAAAPAPPPPDAPQRLVRMLVEAGWITLAGPASAVAAALDGEPDADSALEALVACPAVEEITVSEARLLVLLETW